MSEKNFNAFRGNDIVTRIPGYRASSRATPGDTRAFRERLPQAAAHRIFPVVRSIVICVSVQDSALCSSVEAAGDTVTLRTCR